MKLKRSIDTLILSMLGFVAFSQVTTTRDLLIYDLCGEPFRTGAYQAPWGKHEGYLNGLPSDYAWCEGARPGSWRNSENFDGITVWGQVYVEKGGSPETKYRVQVRNIGLYKYEDNEWSLIHETPDNGGGNWYTERFDNGTATGNKRNEPAENGGGISITMIDGHNYHWWDDAWPRSQMPHDADAIFSNC